MALCLAQPVVTVAVTGFTGAAYPKEGLIIPYFMLEFGISMFLITYASDMLSLWVSSLAHTTTSAMTHLTISNPGLKVIAAQSDTNNRPYATISDMISKMRDNEIGGTVTVCEAVDLLAANPDVQAKRGTEITVKTTPGKLLDLVGEDRAKTFLEERAARANYIADDSYTLNNVVKYRGRLGLFILAFALLAMFTLEFIDKDKR